MKFTEIQLRNYASPVGVTEGKKCKNALAMVRNALRSIGYTDNDDIALPYPETFSYTTEMELYRDGRHRKVKIFVQGSYANKTNIPSESDVDIAVELVSTFWSILPFGISTQAYGFTDSSDTLQAFKDDIETLLKRKFLSGVVRHDKSINVRGNSYRVDADIVPCGEYRDYRGDHHSNPMNFVEGVIIRPDTGGQIINYPKQHIENGITKNRNTNYIFKKMVRIAKRIRENMMHLKSAQEISSYLIESLLWNIPDEEYLRHTCFRLVFNDIVEYLHSNISTISLFKEINGIKHITDDGIGRVVTCRKFINDIRYFYEYDINE